MTPTPMTEAEVGRCVEALIAARIDARPLDFGGRLPANLDEAHRCQDAYLSAAPWSHIGWKIGCTSEPAQQLLGCPSPFAGPVFDLNHHRSGASVDAGSLINPLIEGEIAFDMIATLAPRPEPYSEDEVRAAVGVARPTVELADTRHPDIFTAGAANLVADCGGNGGLIVGPPIDDWSSIDLAAAQVEMTIDAKVVGSGRGADVLGHPLTALTWLANSLRERGRALEAGHIVSTGTCTGAAPIGSDQTAVADYGPLGTVEVTLG